MIHSFLKTTVRLAKFPQTIVIILFVTALTSPYATSAVVTANGFQLKLNGQPFVVKGMITLRYQSVQRPAIFHMAIISFLITPMSGSPMWTICARPAST